MIAPLLLLAVTLIPSVLCDLYVYDYVCTRADLYDILICTDGMNIHMCLCVLLVTISMVYYWLNVYHLQCVLRQIIY